MKIDKIYMIEQLEDLENRIADAKIELKSCNYSDELICNSLEHLKVELKNMLKIVERSL